MYLPWSCRVRGREIAIDNTGTVPPGVAVLPVVVPDIHFLLLFLKITKIIEEHITYSIKDPM